MKQQQTKFLTNTFWQLSNEYRKNLTEENDIEQIDMTQLFYKEIDFMIKNNELINININGKVRLGKSTEAIAIGQHIFKQIIKNKQRPTKDKFTIQNIARDDQEYSKLMRNPKLAFTVIVTDESNELEKGGENSSVEQALQKVFSDVQAGRYVHRVSCSPKELIDGNSDIILEIVSVNKQTRTSHNKLYYKMSYAGQELIQPLGYVNIYVGDVIEQWENTAKKIYFKNKKTKKEKEILESIRITDLFTEYMIKKYEKMELITKEGIFRPRLLDYADIILTVTNQLKDLTRISNILNAIIELTEIFTIKIGPKENIILTDYNQLQNHNLEQTIQLYEEVINELQRIA